MAYFENPPETIRIANGVETVFGFDWTYQVSVPSEVVVKVNEVTVPTVLSGTAEVVINPAPPLAAVVRIFRSTDIQDPKNLFSAGIPFLPKYVDENNKQLLNGLQEGLFEFQGVIDDANDIAQRSVRAPSTDPVMPPMAPAAARAGKILGFDSAGNPIATLPNSGPGSGTELAADLADGFTVGKGASLVARYGGGTMQDLFNYTDPLLGVALLPVTQPWSAGFTFNQAAKNRNICHLNDFNPLPANTWVQRAYNGAPAGAVLYLPAGRFRGQFVSSRSNITVRGAGCSVANAGRTKMADIGTVLEGRVNLNGSHLDLSDFSVDSGTEVAAAINGGVPMDGFVSSNWPGPAQVNVKIQRITALGDAPTSTSHAVLIENISNFVVRDVYGFGGCVGVVIKCQNGVVDNIRGYRNGQSAVQFKSDSYANCSRVQIGRVYGDDEGLNAVGSVGVFFYAASAQLQHLNGGTVYTKGFKTGTAFNRDGTSVMNDIHLDTVSNDSPFGRGLEVFGEPLNCSITTYACTDPLGSEAYLLADTSLGFHIGAIYASVASPIDTCGRLGGVFTVGTIVHTTAYGSGTPLPGITVTPHATFNKAWRIGTYSARLTLNSLAGAAILNGWNQYTTDSPRVHLEGSRAFLSGTFTVPATPWTGKESFYQMNPALAPTVEREFFGMAIVGAGTTAQAVPVSILITVTGLVQLRYMNAPSAVPATITRVVCNGINWAVF